MSDLHVCCSVANTDRFEENLAMSRCLQPNGGPVPLTIREGWTNVPAAYNSMMEQTQDYKYRAFIHEDVKLTKWWHEKLLAGIKEVESKNKWWDVIGVAGVLWVDQPGGFAKVYAGNYGDRGKPSLNEVELPVQAETVDEMVIVVKNGRKFDELNPFHHLMGADLCWRSRRGVYIVDAWCDHNTRTSRHGCLPMEFAISAGYMWAKHYDRLPLVTNCATIQEVNGVCSIVY